MNLNESPGLLIASGGDPDQLIRLALTAFSLGPRSAVIALANDRATPQSTPFTNELVESLRDRGCNVRTISPASNLLGSWSAVRKTVWVAVTLPKSAERLEKVWLPEPIVQATTLIAINTLPSPEAHGEPIAIGLWARFAHPRQRTGAWMSPERDGLAPEIALALKPRLILLVGEWKGSPLVIASNDQIVAELAALAWMQTMSKTPPESGGPWENPLVQRATELGLGVSQPGEIVASIQWNGDPMSPPATAFTEFADNLLARIGVSIS